MYPYYMREVARPRKDELEIGAAIVAIVMLVVCAMASAPRLSLTTYAARAAKAHEQNKQSIATLDTTTRQLQTRNEAVEAQLAKVTKLLESARSDLAKLREGHDALGAQVTATAVKVQQLSAPGTLQKLTKERDDARAQARQRDDQVRQLTLALQKAGVYP